MRGWLLSLDWSQQPRPTPEACACNRKVQEVVPRNQDTARPGGKCCCCCCWLLLLLLLLLEQLLSSWLWCQAHLRDFLQPNFFQGFTRKYESHGDGLEPTATEMATGVVSAMGSNTRSSSGPATSLTGSDLNKRLKRLNTEVCCYCYHTNPTHTACWHTALLILLFTLAVAVRTLHKNVGGGGKLPRSTCKQQIAKHIFQGIASRTGLHTPPATLQLLQLSLLIGFSCSLTCRWMHGQIYNQMCGHLNKSSKHVLFTVKVDAARGKFLKATYRNLDGAQVDMMPFQEAWPGCIMECDVKVRIPHPATLRFMKCGRGLASCRRSAESS